MTNTTRSATADVLAAVQAKIARRIEYVDHEGAHDWVERESYLAYRDLVRTLTCWVTAEGVITASVADTSVAWIHADGVVGDVLDVDTSPVGEIVEVGPNHQQLRW